MKLIYRYGINMFLSFIGTLLIGIISFRFTGEPHTELIPLIFLLWFIIIQQEDQIKEADGE